MDLPIDVPYHVIDGYPCYYVTNTGDVYTYRDGKTGWQGFRKLALKGRNNPNRYIQVALSKDDKTKYVQVHRIVAKYFCPGYREGYVINHKDGDKHNNNYENLEWVTQKENVHKSYVSSGIGPTRNYKMYDLRDAEGNLLGVFVGMNKAAEYVIKKQY